MELKDQQAKNETVDQQVQAGETVHQQGVHVHYYGAATYYNDCITFPGGLTYFGFSVHLKSKYTTVTLKNLMATQTIKLCLKPLYSICPSISCAEILQLFYKCYV